MKFYNIDVPNKYKDTPLHSLYFFINIVTPLIVLGWTLVQVYTYVKLQKISKQMEEQAASIKQVQKQIEEK